MSSPEIFKLLKKVEEEDFIDKVTFNETISNCQFIKKGNTIFITYQGEAKTHSANDVLFTLPERI